MTTPSPGVNQKLQSIRNWTISTYKCSRQTLYERLGKTNKTVDVELDGQIQTLRETREKYDNILRLSRALTSHFYHVVTTQVHPQETCRCDKCDKGDKCDKCDKCDKGDKGDIIGFYGKPIIFRVPLATVSLTLLTSPRSSMRSFS